MKNQEHCVMMEFPNLVILNERATGPVDELRLFVQKLNLRLVQEKRWTTCLN